MSIGIMLISINVIATFCTFLLVLPKGANQKGIVWYLILIGFFLAWSLVRISVELVADEFVMAFLERLSYVFGIGIVNAFLNFALHYPYSSGRLKRNSRVILGLCALVLAIVSLHANGIVVSAMIATAAHFFTVNLEVLTLYNIYFVALSLYAFYVLVGKYKKSPALTKRNLKPVIITTALAFVGGFVMNLITPYVGTFSWQIFGPVFTLPFTLTVAYAVLKPVGGKPV